MVNTQGKKNKGAEKGGPMTLKANCLFNRFSPVSPANNS